MRKWHRAMIPDTGASWRPWHDSVPMTTRIAGIAPVALDCSCCCKQVFPACAPLETRLLSCTVCANSVDGVYTMGLLVGGKEDTVGIRQQMHLHGRRANPWLHVEHAHLARSPPWVEEAVREQGR